MALKDYPDWVLKHKGNGREIRCIRGRYYLYQVHSERMNGKVKKFTDKYLGRITEEGLIPPRPKKVEYHAKRFGLTAFIFSSCRRIIKGLIKRYPSKHKKLLSLAILKYFFDNDLREYDKHYISVLFPEVKIKEEKMSVQDEIDRIVGMMLSLIHIFVSRRAFLICKSAIFSTLLLFWLNEFSRYLGPPPTG